MGGCGCSSISSTAALQTLIQAAVEQLVIFNGVGGEGSSPLSPLPMGSVSGAVLGADTDYHLAFVDSHPKKFIQIVNRTDADIYASLDGTNIHFHITSGSSQTLPLGSVKAVWSGNVYAKQDVTNPPTTGVVEVSAFY